MAKNTTNEVLQRVDDTLFTARQGLVTIKESDARARVAGLRNVIVFGRAVTNVLQNLRSAEPDFDEWYKPHVATMQNDPLMLFFYRLRSEILKLGVLAIGSSISLSGNPMAALRHVTKPPRAKGFFIGDQIGGSGWEVETEDGATEKFYVQLPDNIPGLKLDVNIHLIGAPGKLRDLPAVSVCEQYLDRLSEMVRQAKSRFSPKETGRN